MQKFLLMMSGLLFGFYFTVSCGQKEYSLDEIKALQELNEDFIKEQTTDKPGPPQYKNGRVAGERYTTLTGDPKTFNEIFSKDGTSSSIIDLLLDSLADYDPYKREFIPRLATFTVETDPATSIMRVIYTLRDDIYWTTADGKDKVRVLSDDVIYYYNEIVSDPEMQHLAYNSQFVEMPDGKQVRLKIERIDDKSFAFIFPRPVAFPIYQTNMNFGPMYKYKPAKEKNGVDGVFSLFAIDTDVKTIPSVGPYHIVEYTPGVRVVMQRNPDFWKKDAAGTSYPYTEKLVFYIVPDLNAQYLKFKGGDTDFYSARIEDLTDLIAGQGPKPTDFTVYSGGETSGADFFCFNQNPNYMDQLVYSWFKQVKFRQAMSCLVNRQRIAKQIYRGLAGPALYYFANINPYYNADIVNTFTFDQERARKLLGEIGIAQDPQGVMRDSAGNAIEFEIIVNAENNIRVDICNIFIDELKKMGIKATLRPVDFHKMVDMLDKTYDWEVLIGGFGGGLPTFPTSGSNVWRSDGNYHLWHPKQTKPATEWEARIDYLYNEGSFTPDPQKAKAIWDEYQKILCEQLPLIYVVHSKAFLAARNRWDNVYFDNKGGIDQLYLFLK